MLFEDHVWLKFLTDHWIGQETRLTSPLKKVSKLGLDYQGIR